MIRQKVIDNYRDMVASLKTELKLAEAEVERLQKSYAITNESWQNLQAENARLRKVMNDVMNIALNGDAEEWLALREVLAEVERPGDTEPTEP